MNALIIYKSKTGFTKWYAEFIAKEVDAISGATVSSEVIINVVNDALLKGLR